MIRATCPCCGAVNEFDTLVQHEYGRKAVVAAAHLPPALFAQTMRYLRLFVSPVTGLSLSSAPAPQRALTMDRAATLLDALVQAIDAAKVTAKGRDWSAPLTAWPEAFDAVFAAVADKRRKLPLTNHAYLFGCIANMADAVEGKQETATEQARKSPVRNADPEPVADAAGERSIPPEALAVMAALTSRKSMAAVTPQQAALDAPTEPLLEQFARINKGRWKGKGGTIVRVAGDQVYVAIQFPRNGLQTIPFNRSELSL